MRTRACAHVRARTHMHTCECTHTHAYTHTNTHPTPSHWQLFLLLWRSPCIDGMNPRCPFWQVIWAPGGPFRRSLPSPTSQSVFLWKFQCFQSYIKFSDLFWDFIKLKLFSQYDFAFKWFWHLHQSYKSNSVKEATHELWVQERKRKKREGGFMSNIKEI